MRLLFIVSCAALVTLPSTAFAQRRPYSESDLELLLSGGIVKERVLRMASSDCVDFRPSSQVDARLRKSGADDTFISELRSVCRKLPEKRGAPVSGRDFDKTFATVTDSGMEVLSSLLPAQTHPLRFFGRGPPGDIFFRRFSVTSCRASFVQQTTQGTKQTYRYGTIDLSKARRFDLKAEEDEHASPRRFWGLEIRGASNNENIGSDRYNNQALIQWGPEVYLQFDDSAAAEKFTSILQARASSC